MLRWLIATEPEQDIVGKKIRAGLHACCQWNLPGAAPLSGSVRCDYPPASRQKMKRFVKTPKVGL
jgi:hypothetical protein